MFPHQFVRVFVRRIWRKKKHPKPAAKTCNKCLGLLRNMGRSAVNDDKNPVLGADQQPPEKLDENIGIDAACFLDHDLIWPREVTAEIRLMRYRAPVLNTTGVSPFLPKVRPA